MIAECQSIWLNSKLRPFRGVGGGGGSTQADPGLRPSGHLLRKCSLRHPASAVLKPIQAFALRAIRFANARSGFLPAQDSGQSWPPLFGPFASASCLRRTQANPGLRPSGHSLRECSLRLPASAVRHSGYACRVTIRIRHEKGPHCGGQKDAIGSNDAVRCRLQHRQRHLPDQARAPLSRRRGSIQ
jgi:hypothetical protein